MTEWMLFLTMIRADHGKPVPPKQPAAIVLEDTRPERLSVAQREELRQAVEKLALQSTGKLVRDKDSGLFVPDSGTEFASREIPAR